MSECICRTVQRNPDGTEITQVNPACPIHAPQSAEGEAEPCIEMGSVFGASASRCCHGITWLEGEDFGKGQKGLLQYACEDCVKHHGYIAKPEPQQPKTDERLGKLLVAYVDAFNAYVADMTKDDASQLEAASEAIHQLFRTERVSVFAEYKKFKPRDCPTCGKQMKAWPSVQGVWTDTCPTCDVSRPAELKGENQ